MPPATGAATVATPPTARLRTEAADAVLELGGDWRLGAPADTAGALQALRALPSGTALRFASGGVGAWDSSLVAWLVRVLDEAEGQGLRVQLAGLPEGVGRLLALATAVPEQDEARKQARETHLTERVGAGTQRVVGAGQSFVEFVGDVALALLRFVSGRAQLRVRDLGVAVQQAGADALPVVWLVNFLVGLILAFVGAAQLEQFGATLYVANLVGIAVVRDMAAIMTAIILAGRSGAAYAAALGTMQTNQEIDALAVAGISPIDALVLPRVLALTVMTPLLTLYGELLGILGGALVSSAMFDISLRQFVAQLREVLQLKFFTGGMVKATVYGALVAMAGCWHGMRSGRSAEAVG
ncbi:MAG: ABC transporter permease, partial [Gemmatimonadales bacterium]|nr:ABC transporter permease [Gemmatimonadales bacterium]